MSLTPTYIYRAQVVRVIDGDTFIAQVDLGFNTYTQIEVRLHGVNCPEKSHPEGKVAKEWVTALIDKKQVVLQSYKDAMSFTRWVCDVEVDGKSLTQAIIDAKQGVPFDPKVDKWTR